MTLLLAPLTILGVLALHGCNYRELKGTGSPATGKFAQIQEKILAPKCVGCHSSVGAADGIDLSSHAAILRSQAVVPLKPNESSLYTSVTTSVVAKRMPKDKDPLDAADLELIRAWIQEGAKENDSGEPPSSQGEASYQWIAKNILETRCVVCHNTAKPRGKVDLSSYESLVASLGNRLKPVVSGDPEKSGLYIELAHEKMPPVPKKLTAEETVALRDWIVAGAPEKTPGAPAPDPLPIQPTYEWLSKNVLGRRCGSCHGIPYKIAAIDFTSHATLLASVGPGMKALTPGSPDQSGIYLEIINGHMPPKRRSVSADEIAIVRRWILDGAKKN